MHLVNYLDLHVSVDVLEGYYDLICIYMCAGPFVIAPVATTADPSYRGRPQTDPTLPCIFRGGFTTNDQLMKNS